MGVAGGNFAVGDLDAMAAYVAEYQPKDWGAFVSKANWETFHKKVRFYSTCECPQALAEVVLIDLIFSIHSER